MNALHLLEMALQQSPGRPLPQCRDAHCFSPRRLNCTPALQPPRQLAFRIAALFDSMQEMRSVHDFTKDLAPSSCSRAANLSMSNPALAKLTSTRSQSPP